MTDWTDKLIEQVGYTGHTTGGRVQLGSTGFSWAPTEKQTVGGVNE